MTNPKQLFSEWLQRRREKNAAKRHAELVRAANDCLNVVEYNGEIYFAYKSIPLVKVGELRCEVTDLLLEARATFMAWTASRETYNV